MINHIFEGLDEFERDEIAMKLKRGRKKKAEEGGYSGGVPPYGYKAIRGTGVLEINEDEVKAVKRIFELTSFSNTITFTLKEIADILNKEGYRGRKGNEFNIMLVKRILDKEQFYKGYYKYTQIESIGKHPSIL